MKRITSLIFVCIFILLFNFISCESLDGKPSDNDESTTSTSTTINNTTSTSTSTTINNTTSTSTSTTINTTTSTSTTLPHGIDNYELGQAPNDIIKYNNGYVIISSTSSIAQVFYYKESNTFLTLINQGSETISTLSNDGTYRIDGRTTARLIREFSLGTGYNPYKATIVGDKLFTTALMVNRLLIHNLTNGSKIKEINIPNDGIYYSRPSGIVNYGNYIFIACSFYYGESSVVYRNTGKVFVYDYVKDEVKGYINIKGKNSNALYIKDNILYIISSGSYSNNGSIEKIDLLTADFSNPSNVTTTNVLSGKDFMTLVINGNYAYIGDGAEIIRYNTNTWTSDKSINLFPTATAIYYPYISALTYSSTKNKIYAIEFASRKLNVLDIALSSIENNYTTGDWPTAFIINE